MKNYLFVCLTLILVLNISIFSQWELRVDGLPNWSVANPLDVAEDSTIAMFVSKPEFPRPINISHNLGKTWTNYITPDIWDGTDVSIIDKNNIWFCTDIKIYHSNNGGIDWELQYEDPSYSTYLNFIHFFNKDTGIVVGDVFGSNLPAHIIKTTDGGENWEEINDSSLIGEVSRDVFHVIEFPTEKVGYFYGSRNKNLYKTIDGGVRWEVTALPNEIKDVFMLVFYDEYLGILVQDNNLGDDLLYRTTDGGLSWKELPILTNTGHHDIEFLLGNPSKIWFTDYDHLFYSSDTGNTWQEVNIIDGILEARNIEFLNDSIGFNLCDNGKFFATENNGGIVTSVESIDQNIGADYKLYQNYPNPFNPITTIKYSIPEQSNVTLKIFDITGSEVITLVNTEQSHGNYEVEFDASKNSSGIYFYRLTADNYVNVKKMILMK